MHEMKDSGVEWIGAIPQSYSVIRMRYLINDYKAGPFGSALITDNLLSSGNILCYTPEHIANQSTENEKNLFLPESRLEEMSQFLVKPGDVIFPIVGSLGRAMVITEDMPSGIINQRLAKFSVDAGKIDTDYFMWLFAKSTFFQPYIDLFQRGSIIVNLTKSIVYDMPFVIPPTFHAQTQLVSFLDKKSGLVDTLISNVQAQIEKLKAYKQSVITEAVTKGLDPTAPMKDSGVEWLGEVPAHWGIFRIANLYAERSESGLPELPILTVSINSGVSDHEIADKDKDRVFIRMEDRTKYKRVCPGDLTYNMMRAWQGAFGAVRVDGLVSPAYVVAKPKNEIPLDSRYIEALLRTPVAIEEMHRYSRGIIDFRLRLYWPEFKNIQICLPPIDEQRRIADYIDKMAPKVDALIAIKQAKIEKLEQYKRSLIYEYVTGKREVVQ